MPGFDIHRKQKSPLIIKYSTKPQISISVASGTLVPAAKTHRRSLSYYFDRRQVFTVLSTFLLTFILAISTSQGLAEIDRNSNQNVGFSDSLKAVSLPNAKPLPVISVPQTMKLNDVIVTDPTQIYLPIEKMTVPDPLKERKEFLKKYLGSKNSVLADHVDALSEQTQWKLIIAISRAESSYCKRHAVNNCWGIGGAWNLKAYQNYDQAIADVNRILEQHYIQAGLNSPAKIVNKWVGHPNDNWQEAVQEELSVLKNAP